MQAGWAGRGVPFACRAPLPRTHTPCTPLLQAGRLGGAPPLHVHESVFVRARSGRSTSLAAWRPRCMTARTVVIHQHCPHHHPIRIFHLCAPKLLRCPAPLLPRGAERINCMRSTEDCRDALWWLAWPAAGRMALTSLPAGWSSALRELAGWLLLPPGPRKLGRRGRGGGTKRKRGRRFFVLARYMGTCARRVLVHPCCRARLGPAGLSDEEAR